MTDVRIPTLLAHELFEMHRDLRPGMPAISWGDAEISYGELGSASDRLAALLCGAGLSGRPIGVFFERGFDIAIAVLGVLKAGCAYVPLDPAYPDERLTGMLRDSRAELLLTEKDLANRIPGVEGTRTLVLEEALASVGEVPPGISPEPPVGPDSLAYIIYTSGSTGAPKGVAMPHGPLANLIGWQRGDSRCGPGSRTLQFAALSFDVSFQEMFSTWAVGGTLVVADNATRRSCQSLIRLLDDKAVERIFLPFVALQALAEHAYAVKAWPSTLREVITAGEQLQVTPAVRALFENLTGAVLVNQYGPSETHVVTSLTLTGDPHRWPDRPSIGRPITGAKTYVVDENLRPVPAGITGELCIGGPVLAEGYLGRPEATATKFRTEPAIDGGRRVYLTGDLVERLPGGDLQFLGRADDQVKIRGHRVETGEVESRLRALPEVADAAVVVREQPSGTKQLVAFCVPVPGAEILAATMRRSLGSRLPEYMIPSSFKVLPSGLPLTPSGKVDRKALSRQL